MVSQKGYGAVLFDEWVPDSNYSDVAQGTPFDFGFGAVTNALIRGSGPQMTYFMPQITIMIILMKQHIIL